MCRFAYNAASANTLPIPANGAPTPLTPRDYMFKLSDQFRAWGRNGDAGGYNAPGLPNGGEE